ncbi:MAG: hypothetical protein NWE89_06495 [Candidatus Bathyarchaeota archaeon]|nr:hypothetical protein [Candidatus Bathyarchaeota archaeon]
MTPLKGILKRGSKKTSLSELLRGSYPDVTPLNELVIPFAEASVRLSYRDSGLNKRAVFRMGNDKQIELFTDVAHLRDYVEVSKDAKDLMKRLTKDYNELQASLKKRIKQDMKKEREYAKLLEASFTDPNIGEVRRSHIENETTAIRRRLRENRVKLSKPKPRHQSGIYLALALSAPVKIGIGELGRTVARLMEATFEEFTVLPKSSECGFNHLIFMHVRWNQ